MTHEATNAVNQTAGLTPYDTGARCEARAWILYGTKVSEIHPAENFGKVDFDDDASETVATAWIEKNDDGTFTLHVENHVDPDELKVVRHDGE